MSPSTRWMFAAAYLVPLCAFAFASALPPSSDEMGVANAAITVALGIIGGVLCLIVAFVKGIKARREMGRLPWFDNAIMVAAALPVLIAVAAIVFIR